MVRNEFEIKNELSLNEIYDTLSKISSLEMTTNEIHHRIRSAIYHLKKNNEIVRVGVGRYKKSIRLGN